MKFCFNCGKELEEGLKFCRYCGKPQSMVTADASAQPGNPGMMQGARAAYGLNGTQVSRYAPTGGNGGSVDVNRLAGAAKQAVNLITRNITASNAPGEMELSSWGSSLASLDPSSLVQSAVGSVGRAAVGTAGRAASEAVKRTAMGRTKANVCPRCGKEQREGAKFCLQCGNPLTSDAPGPVPASTGVNLCRQCGSPLEPGYRFCMKCGAKV